MISFLSMTLLVSIALLHILTLTEITISQQILQNNENLVTKHPFVSEIIEKISYIMKKKIEITVPPTHPIPMGQANISIVLTQLNV